MATIKDYITEEFLAAGFAVIHEKESMTVFSHNVDMDFWGVIENHKDVLCIQNSLYSEIKSIINKIGIERNISLLVLNDSDTSGTLSPENIVEIENDPLFFKKYVLQYRGEAWKYLDKEILSEGERLGNILTDKELFASLKEDSKDGSYYLLYTIVHKLPFVKVAIDEQKDIDSLYLPSSYEIGKSVDVLNRLCVYGCDSVKDQLKIMLEEGA